MRGGIILFNKIQIPKQGSTASRAQCQRRIQHRGGLKQIKKSYKLHQLIKLLHEEINGSVFMRPRSKTDPGTCKARSSPREIGSNKCVKDAYMRRINISHLAKPVGRWWFTFSYTRDSYSCSQEYYWYVGVGSNIHTIMKQQPGY